MEFSHMKYLELFSKVLYNNKSSNCNWSKILGNIIQDKNFIFSTRLKCVFCRSGDQISRNWNTRSKSVFLAFRSSDRGFKWQPCQMIKSILTHLHFNHMTKVSICDLVRWLKFDFTWNNILILWPGCQLTPWSDDQK